MPSKEEPANDRQSLPAYTWVWPLVDNKVDSVDEGTCTRGREHHGMPDLFCLANAAHRNLRSAFLGEVAYLLLSHTLDRFIAFSGDRARAETNGFS